MLARLYTLFLQSNLTSNAHMSNMKRFEPSMLYHKTHVIHGKSLMFYGVSYVFLVPSSFIGKSR